MNHSPRPTVACIIPCFNSSETIGRCVKSVVDQTYRATEIVVVDDGSTDESFHKLEQLSVLVPELKVIRHETNLGPAQARNTGWDATQCDWVAFLDADDTWHPQKLEAQFVALSLVPNCELLGHLVEVSTADEKSVEINLNELAIGDSLRTIPTSEILKSNPFSTPTVLVRRDLDLRFDPTLRFCEDFALWVRASLDGVNISRIELPLARLHKPRFGAGGLSGNMWAMERGELSIYRSLLRDRNIGPAVWAALSVRSLLKYVRRRVILR